MSRFKRKPNRLPEEFYQGGYWYYVTVCTIEKQCILGDARLRRVRSGDALIATEEPQIRLSGIGKIVQETWEDTVYQYSKVVFDQYIIMPNHIHAIIGIEEESISLSNNKKVDLAQIIKAFKNVTTRKVKKYISEEGGESGDEGIAATKRMISTQKTIWQKSFYDRVIRNEQDLVRIQQYIYDNAIAWIMENEE